MRKSFGKRDPSDPAEVGCGGGTSRVEFNLAEAMHRKLCERCGGFTALPAELVQPLLEKAMGNYWIMVYKRMRDDCERLRQDYETYRLDNELLDAIERQNSELRALLEGNGIQMPEGAGKTHLNPHRE
ncbi:MAG: hypothetical protein QFX35_06135, partial [Candidatus Verstraetearchaeota archaeon]|nr:hypothetical protein [Candidatus Verstraetearchaeota archaeon]